MQLLLRARVAYLFGSLCRKFEANNFCGFSVLGD